MFDRESAKQLPADNPWVAFLTSQITAEVEAPEAPAFPGVSATTSESEPAVDEFVEALVDEAPQSQEPEEDEAEVFVEIPNSKTAEVLWLAKHWPEFYRFCLNLNPEHGDDLAQTMALTYVAGAHNIPAGLSPKGWLYALTEDTWQLINKKIKRPEFVALTEAENLTAPDNAEATIDDMYDKFVLQSLRRFMNTVLTKRARQVLNYHYVQELNDEKIGKALTLPTNEVQRELAKSIDSLRSYIFWLATQEERFW